jgi:hypothetical protein
MTVFPCGVASVLLASGFTSSASVSMIVITFSDR